MANGVYYIDLQGCQNAIPVQGSSKRESAINPLDRILLVDLAASPEDLQHNSSSHPIPAFFSIHKRSLLYLEEFLQVHMQGR